MGLALGNLKLEILRHTCGKRVKTKSQKVFGVNSYVCRSYRGKTGRGRPFWGGGLKRKVDKAIRLVIQIFSMSITNLVLNT